MINRVLYKEQLTQFLDNYALNFGVPSNQRIILVVLLCNITQELRKKDSSVKVIDVIEKVIKDEWGRGLEEFLVKVSFQCEALLLGDQEVFSDFGLPDIKDKVTKIREITNNFMPF